MLFGPSKSCQVLVGTQILLDTLQGRLKIPIRLKIILMVGMRLWKVLDEELYF